MFDPDHIKDTVFAYGAAITLGVTAFASAWRTLRPVIREMVEMGREIFSKKAGIGNADKKSYLWIPVHRTEFYT